MLDVLRTILPWLSRRERREIALVFVAALAAALMDILGMASVMPFVAYLSNPDAAASLPLLREFQRVLDLSTFRETALAMGGCVLAAVIAANALNALATWLLIRATAMRAHSLSSRMFAYYIARPYEYYFQRNTAELGHRALHQVARVVSGLFFPAVLIAVRALQVSAVFVLIIVVNPEVAAGVALLCGTLFLFVYQMLKNAIHRAGVRATESGAARQRLAAEALAVVKEVLQSGRGAWFLRRYEAASLAAARSEVASQAAAQLPRYALEALLFGGMVGVVILLVVIGYDTARIVPLVSLYAFAAYRLMPSLQQIFVNYSALRYNRSALDELRADLDLATSAGNSLSSASAPSRLDLRHEIGLRGVSYRFPSDAAGTLEEIDLVIKARSCVGLAGVSGSGKTTLIHLIGGLLAPTAGQIVVDGEPLDDARRRDWRASIGFVSQDLVLIDDSLAANIALGVPEEERKPAAFERAARLAHLHEFVLSELPQGYSSKVGDRGIRLSGGQRQRVAIARALYHDPEVLVFDEATSALDGATERAVLEALAEIGRTKTVVLVAHRLSTLTHCDVIHLVDAGRIVASGSYAELMAGEARFRALAGAVEPLAGEEAKC